MKHLKEYKQYLKEYTINSHKAISDFFNLDETIFKKYFISAEYNDITEELVLSLYNNFPGEELRKIMFHKNTTYHNIKKSNRKTPFFELEVENDELIKKLKI
jgi:hypothetical protein